LHGAGPFKPSQAVQKNDELSVDADGVFKIQGDLSIRESGALIAALAGALDSGPSLTVDLSEVTACDTAGLQILIAAVKQAATDGKSLHFKQASSAVRHHLELLGLGRHIPVDHPR
jgi:anti-anti-sigma factor